MGTVYHLFDKKNNDMMWFYNGQSHYNQSFAVDTLTRNFVVNNKIDTIVNIDGQSYRKKIIVLIAKGREHKRFPLIVEFVYNPKFADIPELDTIISSARAIYNNN